MPLSLDQIPDHNTRAFHGTDHIAAAAIIRDGFKAGTSPGYLGKGVYFFDDQLRHAQRWARDRKDRDGGRPTVIRSTVAYGRVLNVADQAVLDEIIMFVQAAKRRTIRDVGEAAAIDFAAEALRADVVTGVRVPRNVQALRETGFSTQVEKIICVRSLKQILSKEIVWSEA